MKRAILMIGLLGLSSAACAAVTAQTGLYIEGAGGWAFSQVPHDTNDNIVSVKQETVAAGPTIGFEFALTPNFLAGAELSALYLGETKYSGEGIGSGADGSIENYGYQAMAKFTYLNQDGLNFFIKGGAIDETSHVHFDAGSLYSGDDKVRKIIPTVDGGVGYMFNQNLNLSLEYEHMFGENWNDLSSKPSKPVEQNVVLLGLTFKIPMG